MYIYIYMYIRGSAPKKLHYEMPYDETPNEVEAVEYPDYDIVATTTADGPTV